MTQLITIIGAGPAGLSAAIQLQRYGITPLVLEAEVIGGLLHNANLVENYPGFPGGITGIGLINLFKKQAEMVGVQVTFDRVLFSLHTTDEDFRDEIIPVKKWSFAKMAEYGERFYQDGDRKITLNFALAEGNPMDPQVLLQHFNPEKFLIKITPLNPTYQAVEHGLTSYIDPSKNRHDYAVIQSLKEAGYQVIVSIGEVEENYIGSNCGQYVRKHLEAIDQILDGYTYRVEEIV